MSYRLIDLSLNSSSFVILKIEKTKKQYFIFYKFIYFWLHLVFIAARDFSSCGERGLLFVAVCGLLIAVASLVVERGL